MSLREPSLDQSRPSRPTSTSFLGSHSFSTTHALRQALKSLRTFTGTADGSPHSKSMFLKECSLYTCFLLAGWVDATPGALLPAIRAHWNLSFIYVSMLFVGTFCGCIVAAGLVSPMMDRWGFGKMISGAAALGLIFPVVFLTMPPFPVLIVAMFFSGMSTSTLDALVNVWISQRPNADVRLGVTHFLYGVGALSSPLAAIPFVHEGRKEGVKFQYFFLVSLGLAMVVLTLVTMAFRLDRDQHVEGPEQLMPEEQGLELRPRQTSPEEANAEKETNLEAIDLMPTTSRLGSEIESIPAPPPDTRSGLYKLKSVVKQKNVQLLALFTFTYVGTEVTVGGWSSSFLIEIRDQQTSANAIVSGFWAGIAFGRILLIPLTAYLGEQLAVMVYLICAIGLQLLVWLVPNIIANAVALALLGLFLGPAFPAMIRLCEKTVRPRAHLTAAISFISTFAAAGMAILPLLVGVASQKAGIRVLAPMLVGMLGLQVALWGWTNASYFGQLVRRQRATEEDVDRLD